MGKNYSNVDSRALSNSSDGFAADVIQDYDKRIKNQIDSLRKKGYSEDDILLLLFDYGCRPKSNSSNNDVQPDKRKRYIYTCDFLKK